MSRITSIKDAFGIVRHYDEHGNNVGYSIDGVFGTTNHYNNGGKNIGYSIESIFGTDSYFNDYDFDDEPDDDCSCFDDF